MFDTVSFIRGGHPSPACQMGFCARHWRLFFFSYIVGIACFWSTDFTVIICNVLLLINLLIITAYESIPLSYR